MKNLNNILINKLIENTNLIIIIIFWSETCTPCKIMKNIICEIEKKIKHLKIIKININYNKYISEKFSIKSIPTTIIIYKKKIIIRRQGIINEDYIKKIIKKIKTEKNEEKNNNNIW